MTQLYGFHNNNNILEADGRQAKIGRPRVRFSKKGGPNDERSAAKTGRKSRLIADPTAIMKTDVLFAAIKLQACSPLGLHLLLLLTWP